MKRYAKIVKTEDDGGLRFGAFIQLSVPIDLCYFIQIDLFSNVSDYYYLMDQDWKCAVGTYAYEIGNRPRGSVSKIDQYGQIKEHLAELGYKLI